MPKITVDWNTVINFVTDAFVGVGVPREDAKIVTDVLVESDRYKSQLVEILRFHALFSQRFHSGP